jgi:iron complex transport system substrate-binding protein
MIRLAGGENVFANQPQVYLQVSKEVFAAETPDIFAVIDYEGSPSAPSEELARAEFLFKTFPNMPASKNKNWVAVSGAAFAAGVRIPDAIDVMAKAFHPEVFGAVTTVGAKTVYPVTVENCAKQITISKKPERVIVSWGGQAAYLLSLGQTSNLIGMYYRFADEENRVVPPSAREAYLKIPVIGGEKAPGKEVPLALSPDFFYSDSPSDFSPGQATVEDFAAAGATVFSSVYGCTDPNKQTLNLMFAEIKTLGVIFDEQAKAQALVEKIKTDLAKTEAKVAGLTPVKAVLIEGSDQTLYAAGNGLVTDAFARAGGINLFDGATYDAPPSREKLAASEPDVVVNWDTDVEKLAPVMQTVFANAPAVQNKRVVGVRYIGGIGIRVAELVDALAREFHPEAFK